MKTKEGLESGMLVRNRKSGNIGELISEAPYDTEQKKQIYKIREPMVYVRWRRPSGKLRYEFWNLENIELVS